MIWIKDIVFSLCLINIIGSIIYLIWFIIRKFLYNKIAAKHIYHLLKVVIVGFFLATIVVLYSAEQGLFDNLNLIVTTSFWIRMVCLSAFAIWAAGMVLFGTVSLLCVRSIFHMTHSKLSAKVYEQELLHTICQNAHIKRKLSLYHSYSVFSPFVFGMFRPAVYLPDHEYTPEELELILTHEVNHMKQHDVFWKPFANLIRIGYWFNPAAWFIVRETGRWSEIGSDLACCEKVSSKDYFQMICAQIEKGTTSGWSPAATWSAGGQILFWRIKYIDRKQSQVPLRKSFVVLLYICFALCCLFTGYVTINILAKGYMELFYVTGGFESLGLMELSDRFKMEPNEEKYGMESELEEYVIEIDDSGSQIDYTIELNWVIDSGVCKETKEIYLLKGDTLDVQVSTPIGMFINIGIIHSNGKLCYVSGTETVFHEFKIRESGHYRIFVTNLNEVEVDIIMMYYRLQALESIQDNK